MRPWYCRRGCCADALRSDVVRPGKDQRNRKAQEQQGDHQTQRPVGQFPRRKRSGGQLYDSPSRDNVSRSDAINFAPFHFLKEVAVHDRRFGLRGIIFNDEEIDTKMNGAVRFPTMLSRIAKIKAAPSFRLRVYRSKPESADRFAVVPKSGRAVGRKL